jgi:hypothetical protein
MRKSTRRQTKLIDFEPKLDAEEFNALTDVLFELVKENHSKCSRLLGISRSTWKKWEKQPPTWPWWNLVLRAIIKHYITGLHARRGFTAKHRKSVMDLMSRIPQSDEFLDEIASMAYDVHGASQYLRLTLGGKGMFWDELRKPANCGGYSPATLRKAAKMIGVVKRSEGFGEDKRSYWRLPNEDDD